ncbi:MAG: alpha/beta fold hydrolase [Bacillota bacterium]|nr:alpha/beta fold hydrolase [Bacillota bacterium]
MIFKTKREKTFDKGILLLHGFTGSPENMRPLQDKFLWEGYKVSCPALRGHGTTPEDMCQASWRDWVNDSSRELDNLFLECRRVAIAGLSMGGLIAIILAARREVDAIVTISTPIRYRFDMLAQLSPLIRFSSKIRKWPGAHMYNNHFKIGYDRFPEAKLYDLYRINTIARSLLKKVTCPILAVQSKKDELVRPMNLNIILSGVSSDQKESLLLERSPHSCITGLEADLISMKISQFINRYLGTEMDVSKPDLKKQYKRAVRLDY